MLSRDGHGHGHQRVVLPGGWSCACGATFLGPGQPEKVPHNPTRPWGLESRVRCRFSRAWAAIESASGSSAPEAWTSEGGVLVRGAKSSTARSEDSTTAPEKARRRGLQGRSPTLRLEAATGHSVATSCSWRAKARAARGTTNIADSARSQGAPRLPGPPPARGMERQALPQACAVSAPKGGEKR